MAGEFIGWQGEAQADVIVGLLNGNVVGTVTPVFSSPWKNVALNFANIDTLQINTNTFFLVDDIQVNNQARNLPEPGSLALVGAAMVGFVGSRKRTTT